MGIRISYDRFVVWSYKRPNAHSKSAAFLCGDAPMIEEWAYALRDANGNVLIDAPVSGFPTREAAEAAATPHICANFACPNPVNEGGAYCPECGAAAEGR